MGDQFVVTATVLNVRSGPRTGFTVWDTALRGEILERYPPEKWVKAWLANLGWLPVEMEDGDVGFVSMRYLQELGAPVATPAGPIVVPGAPIPPDTGKVPSWMALARTKLGIKEIAGGVHNPEIVHFFDFTSYKATSDEDPWCAAFACAMLEMTGYRSPRNAAAISFKDWGIRLERPQLGSIVVFPHHVGFFDSWADDGRINVLGGNQSNMVTITKYRPAEVVAHQWPSERV